MENNKKRNVEQPPSGIPSVPEIMDVKQLSKYLCMGKSKIYRLIKAKKIPASRIGRQYRFSKEVIDHWLKEKIITREEKQTTLFSKIESNKGE